MEWARRQPITGGGSKYGLQLKIAGPAAKKASIKKPQAFAIDDDDEFSVEDDIARQATKKQSAHEVDVQIKHALEEDASAFAYDDVYEEMKGKQAQPVREDRAKRESKYIGRLIDKAKVRAVEQDMAFERRVTKERQKDDHLYGDKETFVTGAYKKKLIELGKWEEEERRREERDKAHEVSGKRDLNDFYRNLLQKNVAFGAKGSKRESVGMNQVVEAGPPAPEEDSGALSGRLPESSGAERGVQETVDEDSDSHSSIENSPSGDLRDESNDDTTGEGSGSMAGINASTRPEKRAESLGVVESDLLGSSKQTSKEDAVAAARERYLARKKQRKS